jgi:autotransporter translocation and assembly factor TamB
MARKSIRVLVVLVLSLVSVGVWAQTERRRRDPTAITVAPQVFSGENIGVRVTGPSDKSGKVTGTLVVKINGQWVDVTSSMTRVPMTSK